MSRTSKGRYLGNVLPLREGERVQSVLATRDFSEAPYIMFATRNGTVKKTPLSDYSRPRTTGIWAINLDEGDGLVDVQLTNGARDIMLFASNGKAVRFDEASVRSMGRTATGVRGMRLAEGEEVRSLIVVEGDGDILTASQRGYGKRTPVEEYPRKGRGTQGVIAIQTSDRNGKLVGATQVREEHEIMLISNQGTLVRTRASEVAQVGRNTQGVTLIRLPAEEQLVGVERVEALADEEASGADEAAEAEAPPQQPEA
jgi:DNA gyrase subunit A